MYIDLNMVRANVVRQPREWSSSGYHDIRQPRQRYVVLDLECLVWLSEFTTLGALQEAHREWIAEKLSRGSLERDDRWTVDEALGSDSDCKKPR